MSGGRHLLVEGDRYGLVEDLRFPAQGINPPGGVSDPDRDDTTGLLLFAAGSTEMIAGVAQMSHQWKEGTNISPHIHIRAADGTDPESGPNNIVQFKLEYKWANSDSVVPASYTEDTQNFTLPPHSGGQPVNYIAEFLTIDGTGFTFSSLFEWKLSRIGGNEADTYTGDCVLVEFDIHYLSHKLGTTNIYGL